MLAAQVLHIGRRWAQCDRWASHWNQTIPLWRKGIAITARQMLSQREMAGSHGGSVLSGPHDASQACNIIRGDLRTNKNNLFWCRPALAICCLLKSWIRSHCRIRPNLHNMAVNMYSFIIHRGVAFQVNGNKVSVNVWRRKSMIKTCTAPTVCPADAWFIRHHSCFLFYHRGTVACLSRLEICTLDCKSINSPSL